jgi:Chaperone of endosialidase
MNRISFGVFSRPTCLALLLSCLCLSVHGQGTAFTYQGRLVAGSAPASGSYDFRFRLSLDPLGNTNVGSAFLADATPVSNGLFTAIIDFGPGLFTGSNYWLEVDVKSNGGAFYTSLAPLQSLTPTPYAIMANSASNLVGGLSSSQFSGVYSSAVSLNNSANNFTGTFNGNGGGLTNLNAAQLIGLISDARLSGNVALLNNSQTFTGQKLFTQNIGIGNPSPLFSIDAEASQAVGRFMTTNSANGAVLILQNTLTNSFEYLGAINFNTFAGSTPGQVGYLATATNQAYDYMTFRVGSVVALQLDGLGNLLNSPVFNTIAEPGSSHNAISAGVGNVIGTNSYGCVISGGYSNSVAAFTGYASMAGGYKNTNAATYGSIAGGYQNTIWAGNYGNIGGGSQNMVSNTSGTVSGGFQNTAGQNYAAVCGGYSNLAAAYGAFVGGGGSDGSSSLGNKALGSASVIGGGIGNSVSSSYGCILGGNQNSNSSLYDVIGGGFQNAVTNLYGSILGGYQNTAAWGAFVGGGGNDGSSQAGNHAAGTVSVIGGGLGNYANSSYSAVLGGASNTNSGSYGSIGGGLENFVSGTYGTVAGGFANFAALECAVGGGAGNLCNGSSAVIAGGLQNTNTGNESSVGGGQNNLASGTYATIPGGFQNLASGIGSFAAGQSAQATNAAAFVWSDGSAAAFSSTNSSSFCVKASGGAQFFSTSAGRAGAAVLLAPGGNSWTSVSDRSAKKNIQPLDCEEILAKLSQVPIAQWHYKWESDDATPNLGPMAQDFKSAFYPGRDDKSISTMEFDGVELAAIQGLNRKLQAKEAELQQLKARLEALEKRITPLERK